MTRNPTPHSTDPFTDEPTTTWVRPAGAATPPVPSSQSGEPGRPAMLPAREPGRGHRPGPGPAPAHPLRALGSLCGLRATARALFLALPLLAAFACNGSGGDDGDAARTEGCGVRNPATGEVEFCSAAGNEVCVCATGQCAQIDLSCASNYRYVEGVGSCVAEEEAVTLIESTDEADLCPVPDADAGDADGGDAETDADSDAGDGDGDAEVGPLCGNGTIDDGEDCEGDSTQPCTTSCGTTGTSTCYACEWAACAPPAEECNGDDDDCDGDTDEGFECTADEFQDCTTTCGSTGTRVCTEACAWEDCRPPVEACNGADDDCNDVCDDGFDCCAGESGDCTTTCGSVGTRACDAACGWQECVPPVEACNGIDDDCNGMTDEVAGGFACGDGCCNGGETYCGCPGDCTIVVPPPATPQPLAPWNGELTGSFHDPASLRPTFRWAPSVSGGCGTATYEIHVDDSCTTPGFAGCDLSSPTASGTGLAVTSWTPTSDLPVANLPPVGRRYYWHVRACDGAAGCSAWSAVRYLDVGRVPSDFNGDGYSDVAVGAPSYDAIDNPNLGIVYVYQATSSGVPATPTRQLVPGMQPDLAFGRALAAGDVNADGFAELVVGSPGYIGTVTGEGGATVFWGAATGLSWSSVHMLFALRGAAGAAFGTAVAVVGDVNADGYADLAVGSPSETVGALNGAGRVDFYAGSPTLAGSAETIEAPVPQDSAAFGQAIAGAGDLLGDGHGGILVGEPSHAVGTSSQGAAYLFRWNVLSLDSTPWATLSCPAPCSNAHFGSSAALIGDLGDDGYPDFAVGAPSYSAGASAEGNVFAYAVTATGLSGVPVTTLDNPANTANAYFGTALAPAGWVGTGSFRRLGLIVGAPRQLDASVVEGAAFWYAGTATLGTTPITIAAPDADSGGGFGASVAGGFDFNADGTADIVVGAPNRDGTAIAEGRAFVFQSGVGMGGGFPAAPDRTLVNPLPYPNDQFGFSLANACW
ncbi:MAG: FG-GAP repeat protein [Deltaproteobacteria bacterium]|nr:FG-GAP repeat protein [Deltaproteobacteria bacterium]